MARSHRALCLVTAVVAVLLGATEAVAQAQSSDASSANRRAYDTAMKCFVANGRASGLSQRAGDPAAAARYDASGREAFDTALRLGQTLGYSNRRMNQDFDAVQLRELPTMVGDPEYFRASVILCRSLGLMPAG